MEKINIKSSDIRSVELRDIISEIENSFITEARQISCITGWAISDTIEAIASHLYYTDEDYVYVVKET